MSDTTTKVPAGAAALAKGLTLLDLVADAERPMRFSELQERSGLPKPTFARILRTLNAFGLVRLDESKGVYVLGSRFMELSQRVWDTFDLGSVALPEMRNLSSLLGETVALCRLEGDQVLCLDLCADSGLAVRVEPGERVPAYCTAAGKALLAFQDPALTQPLLARLKLEQHTDLTLTSPEALQAELTLTRARGYSVNVDEYLPGVTSVAAVVTGRDGQPIGALSVLAPSSRMTEAAVHPVGRELIAACRRLTGTAGYVAITSQPRPSAPTPDRDLTCVLPWGAQLGEAPVWHPGEQVLYWVDILKPAVCRFEPVTGRNDSRETGKLVSAVLPADNGKLLLATQDGIEWFDFDRGEMLPFVNPEAELAGNRLNDAKIGPDGGLWVGSMSIDAARPSGSLYRMQKNGRFETKETGLTVSNGLGWSPDAQTFYFVDTVAGVINAYDRAAGGTLTGKRVFATIPETEGRPDGLCVDAQGGVWVAIWDGWRVSRYLPDGTLDRHIDLPVPRPTSVCFGGNDLATLYITTARTRLPVRTLADAPLSGGIFSCTPGETGLPTTLFSLD